MKRYSLITVLFFAVLGFVSAQTVPAGFQSVASNGITFAWKVDGKNLKAELSAKTNGWISVGFNPVRKMQGANFIIAYVKDGALKIQDDFGDTPRSHKADTALGGKDNLLESGFRVENEVTTISFTIPLDSGDTNDTVLVPGQTIPVILATGAEKNFTSMHNKLAMAKIKL